MQKSTFNPAGILTCTAVAHKSAEQLVLHLTTKMNLFQQLFVLMEGLSAISQPVQQKHPRKDREVQEPERDKTQDGKPQVEKGNTDDGNISNVLR